MQKNNIKIEKAFIIGVILKGYDKMYIPEHIKELKFLALTAGAETVGVSIQKRNKPDPATYMGKGKIESITKNAITLNCDLIIINDDISPTQIKNIQKIVGNNIKVVDRTGLILDIFTKHARTKESKTQVELARLEYLLPRLTRKWTHLERQMGGIGTRAGAGETQIEIDRRLIRNRISKLKDDLKKIDKQRIIQNKGREEAYRIALVGYTNAGKSTLMNVLTNANTLVKDRLFATLDTTTRKLKIEVNNPVLLSDTIGFIRNLPHNLIASFRSTLGEIRDVDMILKIFDASSDNLHGHIETVEEVLNEIKMPPKVNIIVFNKIDAISESHVLKGLKLRFKDACFISSLENVAINSLISKIKAKITSEYCKDVIILNYKQTKVLNAIYSMTRVLNEKSDYKGLKIEVEGRRKNLDKIRAMLDN